MRTQFHAVRAALDAFVALLFLLVISPYFGVVYLAIDQFGGKPVFVSDEILTEEGAFATSLRFRTTGHGCQEFRALGRFLRKWRIDKWPTMWSVVLGDVSLKEAWRWLSPRR